MVRKIFIFDTTLRDGEQSLGFTLDTRGKLEIARQLAKLNVDVIEAGFPVSSPGDFEAVQAVARQIQGPVICALARALKDDIRCAWEAIKDAATPMIHTFIGTSDIHITGQLKKDKDTVLRMAVEAVQLAKSLCPEVEFSPMDATRTDLNYLCEVIEAVLDVGATVINIPDTVGYALPSEFSALIEDLLVSVPRLNQVRLSVHCHNDLGMAAANSIAGIAAGANQIECTINGLGERAGNAALEEVVAAIKTKSGLEAYTDISTKEMLNTSKLVMSRTGFSVPANKAVVGANAFSHSSGVHQDGVIKERTTFELLNPKDWGWSESRMPLSARSGRHALKHRLEELGYKLTDEQLKKVYEGFLALADKKKQVFDEDLAAITEEELVEVPQIFSLEALMIESTRLKRGGQYEVTANVVLLEQREGFHKTIRESAEGDGPVDAACKAIDKIIGLKLEIVDYFLQSATKGKDAMGEAIIRVNTNGRTVIGRGASTDIVEASIKAYLNAINKICQEDQLLTFSPQIMVEGCGPGKGIPSNLKEFEKARQRTPYPTK